MPTPIFTPDFARFLTELRAHNERDWFQANKERFETAVRDPFLRLIAAFAPGLGKLSPHFVADASPVGEGATPAFHLRLEPGRSTAIAGDAKGWQRVTKKSTLGSACGMIGDSLKRPPPGFDADHPCIVDIKRKDFGLSVALDERRLTQPKLVDDILAGFAATSPFLEFLTRSIGLPF